MEKSPSAQQVTNPTQQLLTTAEWFPFWNESPVIRAILSHVCISSSEQRAQAKSEQLQPHISDLSGFSSAEILKQLPPSPQVLIYQEN